MEGLTVHADEFMSVSFEKKCSKWRWMLELPEFITVLPANGRLVASGGICRKESSFSQGEVYYEEMSTDLLPNLGFLGVTWD